MHKSLVHSMAALLGAASVSVALAQPAPGPGSAAPARAENRAFSRPTERVEARLAYIKTALKITDAQQPQWNAYADTVRKNARQLDERMQKRRSERQAQRASRPTAVQRLERLQTFHAEQANRINELLSVEKPLYAALSPEQQAVADRVLAPGAGRRQVERGHRRG